MHHNSIIIANRALERKRERERLTSQQHPLPMHRTSPFSLSLGPRMHLFAWRSRRALLLNVLAAIFSLSLSLSLFPFPPRYPLSFPSSVLSHDLVASSSADRPCCCCCRCEKLLLLLQGELVFHASLSRADPNSWTEIKTAPNRIPHTHSMSSGLAQKIGNVAMENNAHMP